MTAAGHKKHTEESKRKIGLAHRGKVISEETRRKIGLANKGHKWSTEARLKLISHYWDSPARQARKRMIEDRRALLMEQRLQRQKEKAARKQLMQSVKAYLLLSVSTATAERRLMIRKPVSEETRHKISQSNKGRIAWNKGITAWNYGRRWPEEVRENISKGMITYWIRRRKNGGNSNGIKPNSLTPYIISCVLRR